MLWTPRPTAGYTPHMAAVDWRGLERIAIVAVAFGIAYLGYRLYVLGVTEGRSKVEVNNEAWKFVVAGTGPGLLFMTCGTLALFLALFTGDAQSSRHGSGPAASGNLIQAVDLDRCRDVLARFRTWSTQDSLSINMPGPLHLPPSLLDPTLGLDPNPTESHLAPETLG